MIIGIGTDLVELARIEQLVARQGDAFAKRLLADAEWDDYQACLTRSEQPSHSAQQVKFLAKRWAFKEALAKALGTGIAQGISFKQLILRHDDLGKPMASLTGAALARADSLGISDWQVSISDERHYAVAFVIGQRLIYRDR